MLEFFQKVAQAAYSFQDIGDFFKKLLLEGDIRTYYEKVIGLIPDFYTYILLAFALLMAFFGKKLLGPQKFIAFLAVGFGAGEVYVAPLLVDILPSLPAWVSGLVIGLIAALLCKFLYWIAVAVATGYSVYLVLYTDMFFALPEPKQIIAAVAALVAIVLVFLFLKFFERLGTAFLGGFLSATLLMSVVDFSFIPLDAAITKWILIGVIALLGFIVQIATRSRKYY